MFFKQLAEIAAGMNLTLRINEKDGTLTISVLPDGGDKINALNAVGTPEEMDAGFIEAIRRPLSDTKTMLVNQDEYIQSLQLQVKNKMEEADKKPAGKKATAPAAKSTAKKAQPKKPQPKKVDKKSAKPKPEQVPKPEPKKEEPQKPVGPVQLTIG